MKKLLRHPVVLEILEGLKFYFQVCIGQAYSKYSWARFILLFDYLLKQGVYSTTFSIESPFPNTYLISTW